MTKPADCYCSDLFLYSWSAQLKIYLHVDIRRTEIRAQHTGREGKLDLVFALVHVLKDNPEKK